MEKTIKITEVVEKLTGKIHPAGDSGIDSVRFENLKTMCDLVLYLVAEISAVVDDNKDAREHSVVKARDYADDFLKNTLGISNQ
jgi:hypothetical protein